MKVYLCGPINGCTDKECKDWREDAKKRFGEDNCIDPMRNDYRGKEDKAYKKIVEGDKADIQESDVVLVNYDKPSVGTSMEVFFAWQWDKPVVVVHRPDAVISPWLRYHSWKLMTSFEAAYYWIEDHFNLDGISHTDAIEIERKRELQITSSRVQDGGKLEMVPEVRTDAAEES